MNWRRITVRVWVSMRQLEASGQHNTAAKCEDSNRWIVWMHQNQTAHLQQSMFPPMCNLSCLVKQIWFFSSSFFFFFFKSLIVFLLLQMENKWNTWHVSNQFDYSGTFQTVKVGLAEQPYVPCQILFVVWTQLDARTQLFWDIWLLFKWLMPLCYHITHLTRKK